MATHELVPGWKILHAWANVEVNDWRTLCGLDIQNIDTNGGLCSYFLNPEFRQILTRCEVCKHLIDQAPKPMPPDTE